MCTYVHIMCVRTCACACVHVCVMYIIMCIHACMRVCVFIIIIISMQFEWAWQHPNASKRLKQRVPRRKIPRESGVQHRFRVLAEMLVTAPWARLPLTVRWLKQEHVLEFPPSKQPPVHMPIAFGQVDLIKNGAKKKKKMKKCEEGEGEDGGEKGEEEEEEEEEEEQSELCSVCRQSGKVLNASVLLRKVFSA